MSRDCRVLASIADPIPLNSRFDIRMAINIYFRLAEMQRKYIVWVDAGLGAMVGVITVSLQSAFHLPCRSYGKEGGQDATL